MSSNYRNLTGLVTNLTGSNSYSEYHSINNSITRNLTRTNGTRLLGSTIETTVNSNNIPTGSGYLHVHFHGLIQVTNATGSDNSDELQHYLQRLINKSYNGYSVHVVPYINRNTGKPVILSGNSTRLDADVAYSSLSRFLLGYMEKQANKLPVKINNLTLWRTLPQSKRKSILLSIYNSCSKHLNLTSYRIVPGVRLHRTVQFSRLNNAALSEIKLYFDNLHHVIETQLKTAKYHSKRDSFVSAASIATVPSPRNVCHVVILKNATSSGLEGTPTKNSKIKEAGIRFQLMNGKYVRYFNST